MYATLERTEPIARNIMTFWFRPETPFQYVAGQFTELYLPHDHPDERGQKHWFTISSSPADELFSITTKFASGRSSSFKQVLRQLQPGTRLQFAEPMGDFVLPKDKRIPLLFVAGSIGITPVHSMIKYLADSGEQRTIRLLYNTRREDELAFRKLFEIYDLDFTPMLTKPSAAWYGKTGRISTADILEAVKDLPGALIFLSGPEPMVERLNDELRTSGIPGRRLITDFFHGYRPV